MTARNDIRVPFGFAVAMANQDVARADEVLDEYEAAHRAEVFAEAEQVIRAACFTHNPGAEHGWITCHCEVANELRRYAATAPTS